MPNWRQSTAIFSPSRTRATKFETFVHAVALLPRHLCSPRKGRKCNPCLRNEMSPISIGPPANANDQRVAGASDGIRLGRRARDAKRSPPGQLIGTHPDLLGTARSLSFGLLQHIESLTDQRPGARLAGQSSTGRGCLALDHHSRDWCNLRHSNGSLGTLGGGLSKGRDFAAWIGLTPKQNSSGGKERRERHRKWAARFAAAAHHWRHDRRPLGEATRRAGWYLAGKNDSDETAKANCSRSGQQIGAYRLGSHGPRGVYEDPAPGPA